jgi:carbon storage regulator
MLVLTRGIGESLLVGDDIQVKIIAIRGNRIRIGITAPKSLPVTRAEPESSPPNQSPRRPSP